MSATDELRRLLDERGVEYATDDNTTSNDTMWTTQNGGWMFDCDYMEPLDAKPGTIGAKTELMIYGYTPEQAIAATLGSEINGETSDGSHTFNELYHHRAVLFSVIVDNYRDDAWKAKKHHDGTMYDGMFIVGIDTPWGQASYHYYLDPYWDIFDCEEREAAPEWDGHTPDDAIERIGKLATLDGNGYKQAAAYWKRMFEELLTEHIGEERDDAATPNGGECELTMDGTDECFGCSECLENIPPLANFCPNCGKAVKR